MDNMDVIKELVKKHKPKLFPEGADRVTSLCDGCRNSSNTLATPYPCDVVKLWTAAQALMAEWQTRQV